MMKIFTRFIAATLGLVFLVGNVQSAELKVLCATGMQTVMESLGPQFEHATGHKLVLAFATGGATIERARAEDAADVVIAIREGVDGLAKDGKVVSGSEVVVASTGISIAVRQGASKPDISSPEALKRALLAAKSITYLNPADGGASGIHFAKVLDRLGIAGELKAKTIFAPKAQAVGSLLANGDADLGILQYQLLFGVPGIEIVGPLPGDLQKSTVFSAGLLTASKSADASKALINFLRTPAAGAVIRAQGMEPMPQ
jgi:molybdate transport system substrate-binding protein